MRNGCCSAWCMAVHGAFRTSCDVPLGFGMRTKADVRRDSEFMASRPGVTGAMRFAMAPDELTLVVADRAPKKIVRHTHRPVGSGPSRSSCIEKDAMETRNVQFCLSLGDRRRRRLARLCRDRWHVLAAGVPAADRAGYGLVGHRRVQRHDHRLPRDGFHEHDLGHLVRPAGAAAGGADRLGRAGRKPGAGEPRDIAGRVSVHLRADGRRCLRGHQPVGSGPSRSSSIQNDALETRK